MSSFLSCDEAAAVAHCSELTIKRAIRSGELKAYRPGRAYAIDAEELTRWVKSKPCRKAMAKKKSQS